MNLKLFFIKDVPIEYDYHKLYDYFNKHGTIKEFKVIYNSKMSVIDFIFLEYKNERSASYFKSSIDSIDNHIISFKSKCHKDNFQDKNYYIDKINELKSKIKIQQNSKFVHKDDNLFFCDREKWRKRIQNIDNILKDL